MDHLTTDAAGNEARLYRFSGQVLGRAPKQAQRLRMLMVDTETTGLSPEESEVIEIGMVSATWAKVAVDGWILETVHEYPAMLQQPSAPIPPESTAVHHITDADVEGHSINWEEVSSVMRDHDVVVAFNAPFDRPMLHTEFVRRQIPLPIVPWADALSQVPWKKLMPGLPARNLSVLAWYNGFFYSAHRAVIDCHAAIHLLNVTGTATYLLDTLGAPHYFVFCPKNTFGFQKNDKVKAIGFRWTADRGGWYKQCQTPEERDHALDRLRTDIYGDHNIGNVKVEEIKPTQRYL